MKKEKCPTLYYRIDYGVVEFNKSMQLSETRETASIVYKAKNLHDVYEELFGDTIREYNAKQYRADRKTNITKLMCALKSKAFREVTIQFKWNSDETGNYFETAARVLDIYIKSFEQRNPNLRIFNAEMYLDRIPKLHIDFVPFCHGHKRGLPKTVSFRGALAEQGFYSKDRAATEQIIWAKQEKFFLEKLWRQERKRCSISGNDN